ncbi:GspH/FimT family pseudopilin [Luteimonas sp. A277]
MDHKEVGLTLVELVTTMAVLAITLSIAVPSFAALLQSNRETTTYHLLTTSLASARLSAVKDNAPVTVCPSTDGRRCRNDTIWSDGWIIYRDPGRDRQPATDDAVLQRFDAVPTGLHLRSTAGRLRVRFLPGGWAYGSNLSIHLCRTGDDGHLGSVIVNNGGRPRTSRQTTPAACPFRSD